MAWLLSSPPSLAEAGRGVHDLAYLPGARVHVHAAGQAGVEAAHGPPDVDALEVLGPVLFEDRRVLHRVLIGPGSPVNVPRTRVPGRRRIGLVVGDLAV